MKEIKVVLNKIAQEEKYTMILDATVVPYYDGNSDISAKVIQKYNEFKK
jgi:Skp family chaperone for outer membrane proteins